MSHTEITYVRATALYLLGVELRSVAVGTVEGLDLALGAAAEEDLDPGAAAVPARCYQFPAVVRAVLGLDEDVGLLLTLAHKPSHRLDAKPNGHDSAAEKSHRRGHRHRVADPASLDLDVEVLHHPKYPGGGPPGAMGCETHGGATPPQ